jgi:hypothetical protein
VKWISAFVRSFFGRRWSAAHILEPGDEAPAESGYRIHGDPREVVRIKQDWPEGIDTCISYDVVVEGMSQPNEQKSLNAMMRGTDRRMRLERRHGIPSDANAVAVVAVWRSEMGVQEKAALGWLPKKLTAQIATQHPLESVGARLCRMVKERPGALAGFHIDVGRSSKFKALAAG